MEIGTTFNADWLGDIEALRDAAVRLDAGGVDFVSYGGHVLTARPGRYERPVGTYGVAFRDPFVLYADLAARTSRLRFRTGIVILPMLPTVLVAKQAADLAIASGGRFELGVGISWNAAEYEAFGQQLSTRGRRLDEQLVVLKRLWSEPYVSFSGRFHEIDELGIGQLPPAPIRIWVGCGDADFALARVARLADGWMPLGAPGRDRVAQLHRYAADAGREGLVGITARIAARPDEPDVAVEEANALLDVGVTAISVSPPQGADPVAGITAVLATRDHLVAALDA